MPVDDYGNERNWDNGYAGQSGNNLAAGVTMADTTMSAQNKLNDYSWTLHRQEMDRIRADGASPVYSGSASEAIALASQSPSDTRVGPNRLAGALVLTLKLLTWIGIFVTVALGIGYLVLEYMASSVPAADSQNTHQSVRAKLVAIGSNRAFHGIDISPPSSYISARSVIKTMAPLQMVRYLTTISEHGTYSAAFLQSAYVCIYDAACTKEFLQVTQHDELTLLNGASLFLVNRAEHGDERAAQDACIIALKRPLIEHSLRFAKGTCDFLAGTPTQSAAAKDQMHKLTASFWFEIADLVSKITDSLYAIARS